MMRPNGSAIESRDRDPQLGGDAGVDATQRPDPAGNEKAVERARAQKISDAGGMRRHAFGDLRMFREKFLRARFAAHLPNSILVDYFRQKRRDFRSRNFGLRNLEDLKLLAQHHEHPLQFRDLPRIGRVLKKIARIPDDRDIESRGLAHEFEDPAPLWFAQ